MQPRACNATDVVKFGISVHLYTLVCVYGQIHRVKLRAISEIASWFINGPWLCSSHHKSEEVIKAFAVYLNCQESPNRMEILAGSVHKTEGDHLKI